MLGIIVFLLYTIFGFIFGFTRDYDSGWELISATIVLQILFDIPYIFRERNRTGSFIGSFLLLVPKFGAQIVICTFIGNAIGHNIIAAVGGIWGLIKSIVKYVRKKRDIRDYGYSDEPSAIEEINRYQRDYVEEEALRQKIKRIMRDDDY